MRGAIFRNPDRGNRATCVLVADKPEDDAFLHHLIETLETNGTVEIEHTVYAIADDHTASEEKQ